MLALEGIRVLDLSRGAPGPYCTMILADLGAEVIRIEAPMSGTKQGGLVQSPKGEEGRRAAAFHAANRNKKNIAINLKSAGGRRAFCQLAETADVVVEGFRPGVVERLGIDYKSLSEINPRIIYCSITSYGQDGPYRDVLAHDLNSIAMAGALDVIGEKDGPPVVPLNLLADFGGAAKDAVAGILTALIARGKTGRGQFVDISMLDSVISLMTLLSTGYFQDNVALKRGVTETGGGYPYYSVYPTKDDKYITIGNVEPWLWENFCRAIGREELIPYHFEEKHMYYPAEEKWDEVTAALRETMLTKTRDEWWDILHDKDIFIGKVYSFDEVFSDPQVLHRDMVVEIDHPAAGKVRQIGISIKLSDTPGEVRSLPVLLGENTQELLTDIGYNKQEIDELRKGGDIA